MISTLLDSVELSGSLLSTREVTKGLRCMKEIKGSGNMPVELSLKRGGYVDMRIEKTRKCWNWLGHTSPKGYGLVTSHGKIHQAHRLVFELYYSKKIPNGLVIDHLCRNTGCVNPKHLEAVTQRENVFRGVGFTAMNAKKTHCPKNHPLSGKNIYTYTRKNGGSYRTCKLCLDIRTRAYTSVIHKEVLKPVPKSKCNQVNNTKPLSPRWKNVTCKNCLQNKAPVIRSG